MERTTVACPEYRGTGILSKFGIHVLLAGVVICARKLHIWCRLMFDNDYLYTDNKFNYHKTLWNIIRHYETQLDFLYTDN